MNHRLKRLAGGFPLSLRLIKEMHRAALCREACAAANSLENSAAVRTGSGARRPGNAAFVPPPPERVIECMSDLEHFLHERTTYPALIRARPGSRAVRDDPSLPRRQRPFGSPAHHAHAVRGRRAQRANPVPQPLLQDASRTLLRAVAALTPEGRFGGLARVLSRFAYAERRSACRSSTLTPATGQCCSFCQLPCARNRATSSRKKPLGNAQ